jgi:hypothetical protein
MKYFIRLLLSSMALSAVAQPANITGSWTATVTTNAGSKDYEYVFRQDGGDLIGTIRSQGSVVAISDGHINYKTVTFFEDTIKLKRQAAGTSVEFVATRKATPAR